MQWSAAAVLLAVGLAGCGGGSGDAPTVESAVPGAATIGQSGGRVNLADGAEVVFPPKALGADIRVAITKDSTGAPPLPPSAESAGAVYTITPHGGRFNTHVEVAIPVERAPAAANEQLLLLTAQPGDTQWTVLSGATYSNGKLRAPVMHFSYFRAIVLVDVVMPTLTSTINDAYLFEPIHLPRTNNVGGPGVNTISADFQFDDRNSGASVLGIYSAASMWSQMVMEARLTYPAAASRSVTRLPNATSFRVCRPVSMGHDGAQWRVLREGAPTPLTGVWHNPLDRRPATTYPGNPSRKTLPYAPFEGTEPRPRELFERALKPGFGAVHFFGDSVAPTRGDFMPTGSDDPWATAPQGNIIDDDTYIWHGSMSFDPAVHNGRVQIETSVPTDCNLNVQAVPIAFRLNINVDAAGRVSNPGYLGVRPDAEVVAVGNGDTAVIPFVEIAADSSFSIRWEYSTDPVNWQGQPVPSERIQRGADRQGNFSNGNALGQERPYSIVINNAQLRDAGYYRAWACAKPAGTFCFSYAPAQLAVHTAPPLIALQPVPQTVAVGQTATFTARGLPSGPIGWVINSVSAPTVQWQRRSVVDAAFNIGGWTNIAGATSTDPSNPWRTSYTTPATTAADHGYLYRALFTTSVGTTATEPAVLVVVAPQAAQAPVVTGQPASQNVVIGSTATFVVTVTGTQPMNYQWRKNGASIPGANSATLTLPNVSTQDDANYDIVITNQGGTVTSSAARLTVTPAPGQPQPPQILAAPVSISVAAGNAANFAVAVSGTGPLTYQWLKNGAVINGATTAAFTISPVALADAGSYAVRVTNAQGSVTSAAAALTVTSAPGPVATAPIIAMQPISLAVPPGAGATLAVAVTGTAPFTYQWLRNGEPVAGGTGAMLHFPTVTALDAGQYTVVITNSAGNATSTSAQLIVAGAPVITAQPLNASVATGASASFSVTANGDALRYQWLRNGVAIAGATSATYTTPALTLSDSGAVFSVVVYNAAGVALSSSAVLTVTAPPAAPTWTMPMALSAAGSQADMAAVGAAVDGRATVAWIEYSTTDQQYNMMASRWSGTAWSGAELAETLGANIATALSNGAYTPAVCVGPGGATAIGFGFAQSTTQYIGGLSRFNGSWVSQTIPSRGDPPAIAASADGTLAMLVFNDWAIRSRVMPLGSTAAPAEPLPDPSSATTYFPSVAPLGPSNFVAAWGTSTGIRVNTFDSGAGAWGAPVSLLAPGSGPYPGVVAGGTGGSALAAWTMLGSDYEVFAARYSGGAWSAPIKLAPQPGENIVEQRDSQEAAVSAAVDAAGNAYVAWVQRSTADSNRRPIRVRRCAAAQPLTACEAAVELDTRQERAMTPAVAVAPNGDVFVAWVSENAQGDYEMRVAHRGAGGWTAPVTVGPADSRSRRSPALAVDGTGRAVLAWDHPEGSSRRIFVARTQ
jgi:hypothetical protein